MAMNGISAVIITFNEADRIEACLASVSFCDEIIIVDSGSTDGTQDIARHFTDKVTHHDWVGHKAQKEYAVSLARGPWILLLDADEIATAELAKSIRRLDDNPPENGYLLRRDFYFMNSFMKHGGAFPDWLLRLFKKDRVKFIGTPTHEIITVDGQTLKLEGPLKHYSYRNIEDYFNRFNKYTSLGAADRFEKGKHFGFVQNFRVFYEFIVRYFLKLGFLDGYPGFVYAMLSSFYAWTKYTKLKEIEDNDEKK